ncbi:hypothetical protein IWX65_003593 [Arthrobacter sp. CAN_A214]|uniref:hypothetical protein n=1 Tax=Arthrobacter sp. CAN_A214 TaxID=2787720 RepID=UPI0018CB25B7
MVERNGGFFDADWEHGADNSVAALRTARRERPPQDKRLTDLLDELITRSGRAGITHRGTP